MQTAHASSVCSVLANAAERHGGQPVRVSFDASSSWLRACETALRPLPFIASGAPADVVVTDSATAPGWHFALNGRRLSAGLDAFFWHANRGPHPIELSLHSPEALEGLMRIPPIPGFHWSTQHAAAIDAAPALLGVALMRRAGYALSPAAPPVAVSASERAPDPLSLNWFRAKKLLRSLYLRLPNTSREYRWAIALQNHPASGWRWTTGFAGHEAADPFLVEHQGRCWLFFEDMLPGSRHGRLAVMPAFEPGAEPTVILEKDYHLSYPCVFPHAGEWFMIPESGANHTIDLYRARTFPFEWEYVSTLVSGAQFVDTTPLFHDGRWYLFTAVSLPGRAYLALLFTAASLDAPWRLHPASPLTGDAAIARPAGPIQCEDGRLVRPVQDCLVRYGYSVSLREIVRLTPTAFEERPLRTLLPDWAPGLAATHTYSRAGAALALDGLR